MPTVKPISDLQRNMAEITRECQDTKEPIYLTKNGSAALVVIDAKTYDQEMAIHHDVCDREMRVRRAIQRGLEDVQEGRVRSLDDVKGALGAARGNAHE